MPPSIATVQARLRQSRLKTLAEFERHLRDLDWEDPNVFTLAVRETLNSGFEQGEIAEWLRTTRATVSRWSGNKVVPSKPLYRRALIEKLREHIAAHLRPKN